MMQDESGAVRTATDVVDGARAALSGETSSLGDVVTALGEASYTPLLLLPALAVVSPLSGVPAFSSVCGLLIAAISLQQILDRPHLWLPGWMKRASLKTHRVQKALDWIRTPAAWLDRITRHRLRWLVTTPLNVLPRAVCLCLGLAMPVLELVPFSSSILGSIVAIITAGMFAGDGLLVLIGLALACAIPGGLIWLI